jgi:hypothetical protein
MKDISDGLVRDLQLCQCGHVRAEHLDDSPHACKVCDDTEICDGFKARGAED